MAADGAAVKTFGERVLRQGSLVERDRRLEFTALLERRAAILGAAEKSLVQALARRGPPGRDDVVAEQRSGVIVDRAMLKSERVDPDARRIEPDASAVEAKRIVTTQQLAQAQHGHVERAPRLGALRVGP